MLCLVHNNWRGSLMNDGTRLLGSRDNVPQLYRMDVSRARPQDNGWNRNHMPDHCHDNRRDPYHPNACDNGQDASCHPDWFGSKQMGGLGRNGSRGQYPCPDHNRRAWDPDITCAACKRRGHPASNCDMLAMALFLDKYINGDNVALGLRQNRNRMASTVEG